jgi:N-acyl-L-homoserine lactone synthetase
MFLAIDRAGLDAKQVLLRSMFADRARQFVSRHKWPLRVDESGLEIDEYDDVRATYCLVAWDGRHRASLRLRPASTGSMVEDHFPKLWRSDLRSGVEITRFCAAAELSPDDRLTAVSDLLLGLCRHAQRTGAPKLFGVVFPSVARVIRQAGWDGAVLGEAKCAEGVLLLAQWAPSERVAWEIQERREYREEAWTRRREAVVGRMVA